MKETQQQNNFNLQTIKEKGTKLLAGASDFLDNAIQIFKKDEAQMSTEEKLEKQHLLNFIYGMGAGIVIYHFLIGAILLLAIIWFYNLSLKKTKSIVEGQTPQEHNHKSTKLEDKKESDGRDI